MENLLELSLGDTISVEDDAGGLEVCSFVDLSGQFSHHSSQVLNDLLSVLCTQGGTVAVEVCIHAAQYCSNRRFLPICSWWVGDIGSQEDDRLLEHWRPTRKWVFEDQASENAWMPGNRSYSYPSLGGNPSSNMGIFQEIFLTLPLKF